MFFHSSKNRFFLSAFLQKSGRYEQNQQGFTLIELVIAMSLFSIGLMAIMKLQIGSFAMIVDSQLKQQALMFASSSHEIELLKNQNENSASHLTELWIRQVETFIPNVSYDRVLIGNGEHLVTLFWPVNQGFSPCVLEKSKERDCIRL